MTNLTEGLREGDLNGTILPTISINEYESKLEKNANVIGFYAIYQDPAKDLNRFIQKSSIPLLDTEVSTTPTPRGFYMVFVEMENSEDFIKNLLTLLSNMKNLTNIKKWNFSTIKNNNIPLSEKNLKKYVTNIKKEEKLKEFFYDSYLTKLTINENVVSFGRENYRIFSLGNQNLLRKKHNLTEVILTESATSKTLILQQMLGENWQVDVYNSGILLTNCNTEKSAFIKEV